MKPQDWACIPMPPGHECDSVLNVRGHALKLKSAEESAIARHLCEVHNATVSQMIESFEEATATMLETTVNKSIADAAVDKAIATQEVFTAMSEIRTAAAVLEVADQRYKLMYLKMQLAKAVNDGLISRETLTKIRGLS